MNQPVKPPQNDVAGPNARHKTTQVMVGNVAVGGVVLGRFYGLVHGVSNIRFW